jgi:hypothetical protein
MQVCRYGLLFVLLVACVSGVAPANKPEVAPEVKWARGIADDFWRALLNGQARQAGGLLSSELANSLVTYEWSGPGEKARLMSLPAHQWLTDRIPAGPSVSVVFVSEELSPDRAEVVFRGQLGGKYQDKPVAADFTMRVAKESGGKWAIRFLLVTDRKEP